jgi:hypothetical protein
MNKIKLVILFIVLGISNTYGQKTIDFEIFGAPVYSYRFYKSRDYIDSDLNYPNKGKDYFDKEFMSQIDDLEKPIAGYLFGFRASYHLTNKISLQTGLEYSSIGEKADFGYVPESGFVEIQGVQVPIYSTENYELIMTYKYNYISIPLTFRYTLLDFHKFEVIPCIGMDFSFLVNKSVDNTSENKEIKYATKFDSEDHRYNNLSTALNVGLEFNYSLTDKLQIFASPNIKQYFTPNERFVAEYHSGGDTYILDKINKYNYIIGLNCGLRLRNIKNK